VTKIPILSVLALAAALAGFFSVPACAADKGPHQTLMEQYWQEYQQASNGFHNADIAGTFKKGATNFILFAQKADDIVSAAAQGKYKTVDDLQSDAGTLINWMTLQRNVIAANMENAIRADAARVKSAAESDRAALEALEDTQEQADANLLHDIQIVIARANTSFAAAETALAKKLEQ
jgi:hypothetical protein